MAKRLFLPALAAALALTAAAAPAETPSTRPHGAGSPTIWFAPRPSDFVPMFEGSSPSGPWDAVAGRVDVVSMNQNVLRRMSDEALTRLVKDLDRKRLALAVGILPINWFHETPCGRGVEGYSDPASARQTVAKLKAAGAKVAFITMDEPLWFGHYYAGKEACRSSIDELSRRTSVLVKIFADAYPDAVIGDTEPFPAVSSQTDWETGFADWKAAFHKATGRPIGFLQLDFNWGDPRLNTGSKHDGSNTAAVGDLARRVFTVARRNGLPVGMIFWGGGAGDAQWMNNARLHIREIEAAGVRPDQAVFTSWSPAPAHSFPASDPNALASLIPYYLQRQR